jgi:rhodanese-related sulfurtransferase
MLHAIVPARTPQEFAGSAVLYCASGARSGKAARLLKGAGFTDVVSAGGLGDMPG